MQRPFYTYHGGEFAVVSDKKKTAVEMLCLSANYLKLLSQIK